MDDALIACRAVHFVAAMLVFGGAAFRLYASKAAIPMRSRPLMRGSEDCCWWRLGRLPVRLWRCCRSSAA